MNFLGFDFYGAGNIGDDLMVDGFLAQGGRELALVGSVPRAVGPLQRRAPEVQWFQDSPAERRRRLAGVRHWIGVGGTPFQATSGTWLLDQIEQDLTHLPREARATMCGVGAEEEALRHGEQMTRICARLERISVRDEFSGRIVAQCLPPERRHIVRVGADLAHLSLQRLFPVAPVPGPRRWALGLCYYSESLDAANLDALREMICSCPDRRRVVLIANETRRDFECRVYSRMLGWHWLGGKLPLLRGPRLIRPDYPTGSLEELVSFHGEIETVLSARFHALLAAAWAGCRLVALSRCSKISALAQTLDIPLVPEPFTARALRQALAAARQVPRPRLAQLAAQAKSAVAEILPPPAAGG